jgi:outer membrane receptor protein involved in Fe transport
MQNPSRPNRAWFQKCSAVLALAFSGAFAPGRAEAADAHAMIAVQAKPLRAALVDFAVQANISIAIPEGGFGAARASPVRGDYAPVVALSLILEGTGYSFAQIDAVSFRVFAAAEVEPPAATNPAKDVVITGARRPRTLDRMALAVTSSEHAYLERVGARQTSDITFDAAGVTSTNLGPGRNKILVRGLSDGAFSGRTQSTVGVYFDDSRITYGAPDPDLQLVDVQAVELLRGPQGALYGAGPISGIYHVISNPPDTARYEGSVQVGTDVVRGGAAGNAIEGVFNAPMAAGRAGLRVTGYRQVNGGWLDNNRLGLRNTNQSERAGGRLSAIVRLGDTWTANARLITQRIDAHDSDYVDLSAPEAGRSTRLLEPHESNFLLASVGARGAASGGEVTSVISYTRHRLNERFDASLGSTPFGVSRTRPVAYDDGSNLELIVQEIRYSAVASPLPWYVGAFYSDLEKRSETRITADPDQPFEQVGYRALRADAVRESAVYGTVAFNLSSRAQLSLAARYFWTTIKTDAHASGVPTDNFSGGRGESGLAPRVELSFAPAADMFLYFNAAKGYRTGGFNAGDGVLLQRTPQPMREYSGGLLWSYEAGAKQAFWSGHLRTRIAAFFQNWRGVQSDQLIAAGLQFTGNVGNAQSYGIEAEAAAQISPRLQVRGHASYTQAEVTDADPSFPSLPHSGLPGAPRALAGGSVIYEYPLTSVVRLLVSGQARYIGKSNITYSRQRELSIGGYADVNARLGLATKEWQATLYAENLLDGSERTFSYGNPLRLGGRGIVAPQVPRTIGIEIRRDF